MQTLQDSLPGPTDRAITLDITFDETLHGAPLVLFFHGYKGFKDWGHWALVAKAFAEAGFVFAKINFSHNGTTLAEPLEVADLEAFSHNTLTLEQEEIRRVVEFFREKRSVVPSAVYAMDRLGLLGHSRGGGAVLVHAAHNAYVTAVVAWAPVADFADLFAGIDKEKWRTEGVTHVMNTRTKQKMPLSYSVWADYKAHTSVLNILDAVSGLNVPALIVHGSGDSSVPVAGSTEMATLNPLVEIQILEGADHTFGGRHPYTESRLPADAARAVVLTINFFRDNL